MEGWIWGGEGEIGGEVEEQLVASMMTPGPEKKKLLVDNSTLNQRR